MEIALFILIIVAGFYMAWNIGANDVANAMGTSVGSGALTLRQAVIVAAILEFSGAFFFGSHVSKTVQSGIVNPTLFVNNPIILVYGMLASLVSVGIWLQIASYYGWPVSTTHSIVGAIVGFGAVVGGLDAIYWREVFYIISSWILSPILGGIIGYLFFSFIRTQIFYTSDPVAATRRWTPFMVFLVMLILVSVLVFEGFRNISLTISWFNKSFLVIGGAFIASLISYLIVRKISSPQKQEQETHFYSPEIITSVEKAKKHLSRLQLVANGEIKSHVALILEEVDQLADSLNQKQQIATTHLEYLKVERIFSYLQIMSACMMAFAHGANDVANAIGPLSAAIAILTTGLFAVDSPVPIWALGLGGLGIVVGLATWGWRVIETIGKKITELTPSRGFSAEFGAATTIVLASGLGMPISTTHTLVGAVIGVGFARGLEAINLNTAKEILVSWIVTVPIGAILAILFFYPIQMFFG